MAPLKVPLTLATPWRSSTWTSEWWTRFTTSSWTSAVASCPSSEATSTTSPSSVRVALVGFKHYLILPDMSLNLIQKLSLFVLVKSSSDKFEKVCEDSESSQEYCTTAYLYNITQGKKRTKWSKTLPFKRNWECSHSVNALLEETLKNVPSSLVSCTKHEVRYCLLENLAFHHIIYCGFVSKWF